MIHPDLFSSQVGPGESQASAPQLRRQPTDPSTTQCQSAGGAQWALGFAASLPWLHRTMGMTDVPIVHITQP